MYSYYTLAYSTCVHLPLVLLSIPTSVAVLLHYMYAIPAYSVYCTNAARRATPPVSRYNLRAFAHKEERAAYAPRSPSPSISISVLPVRRIVRIPLVWHPRLRSSTRPYAVQPLASRAPASVAMTIDKMPRTVFYQRDAAGRSHASEPAEGRGREVCRLFVRGTGCTSIAVSASPLQFEVLRCASACVSCAEQLLVRAWGGERTRLALRIAVRRSSACLSTSQATARAEGVNPRKRQRAASSVRCTHLYVKMYEP
ncbi:hypothetical protein FB451DRAFT_166777 [Mycena latifolia]|nr:hypothetical protein FB451DRAFT_166777 [Mycena latifolia]